MGDFIGEGMGEIKVTAYSVDTGESWDVPFKMASRGTLVYELSAVETTAATNNLIFAVSLIPASKENVRRIIVNISVSYYYHEGALNWALWKDGSGSLGKESIVWDRAGNMMTGTFKTNKNGKTITLEYGKDSNNVEVPKIILSDESNFEIVKLTYGLTDYIDWGGETSRINSGILKLAANNNNYFELTYSGFVVKGNSNNFTTDYGLNRNGMYLQASVEGKNYTCLLRAPAITLVRDRDVGPTIIQTDGGFPPNFIAQWYRDDPRRTVPAIIIGEIFSNGEYRFGIRKQKTVYNATYDDAGFNGYHWKLGTINTTNDDNFVV